MPIRHRYHFWLIGWQEDDPSDIRILTELGRAVANSLNEPLCWPKFQCVALPRVVDVILVHDTQIDVFWTVQLDQSEVPVHSGETIRVEDGLRVPRGRQQLNLVKPNPAES